KREVGGTGQIVDGNLRVLLRRGIRVAAASGDRRKRARAGRKGPKFGEDVVLPIVAQSLAHGDVVGRAGIENHKWTQTKPTRQSDRTPHKYPMPDIKGSTPVVQAQVELIRRKVRGAGGVAVGIVQGVETEQRQ